ncbi:YrrS family protein [Bacillus massiliigorillae]|uniref:YrrS family protein n=1 Tax=Bacillus massiliigorillae TaxID=1243664 RepID=UPI0003A2DB81|nr:YrrS family protein [Bacillus massiliigorillae]
MRDDKPSRVASRSEKVGKKRKANTIYNILLVVVILLIIIVGANVFLGNDDNESASPNEKTSHEEKNNDNDKGTVKDNKDKDDKSNDESKVNDDDKSSDKDDEDKSDEKNKEDENKPEEEDKIVDSSDPGVMETRVNDSWKPVGTEQTGEHVTKYDDNSVDWKEMEKALSYGAGIPESDMTVIWLGNGGAPNKAVGTITPKDRSAKYKVYIEWVDKEGWKPTKVEKLK